MSLNLGDRPTAARCLRSGERRLCAQTRRVAARWKAELATVFAIELRSAVISDAVADCRGVVDTGHQHEARAPEPDLLLELNRAEAGHGLEVAMERGCAHPARSGQVVDAEWLAVVRGDPTNRPADGSEAAVGQAELAHGLSNRSGDQPPQDLVLDHRRQDASVMWAIEETEEADNGIEQLARGVADAEGGWRGSALRSAWRHRSAVVRRVKEH